MGKVTSDDEVCYWCYKKLKNLTKKQKTYEQRQSNHETI